MTDDMENDTTRAVMRWILAAFYAAAGVAHLWAPDKLLAITPSWVPFAREVIFVTGLCELAGAVALVTKPRAMRSASGPRTSSMRWTASICPTSLIAGSI